MKGGVSKAQGKEERFDIMIFWACAVVMHVLPLRGREGLMMYLTRTGKETRGIRKHMTITLKVNVKGGSMGRDHLFPCARGASSGLDVNLWLSLLIAVQKEAGRDGVPDFTD